MATSTATNAALNAAISPRHVHVYAFIVHPLPALYVLANAAMVRICQYRTCFIGLRTNRRRSRRDRSVRNRRRRRNHRNRRSFRNLRMPPEDGAAAEIVLRTSAKLELSCAPRSPIIRAECRRGGNTWRRQAHVPSGCAHSRLLERKGMYMYDGAGMLIQPLRIGHFGICSGSAGPSPSWKCRTRWHTPCTGPTTSCRARLGR